MSIRAFGTCLLKHGALVARAYGRRGINTTTNAGSSIAEGAKAPRALRTVGAQVGIRARRLLLDNVLSRVTSSLAAELRQKAARRLLFGDTGPFFAFVGVSLASDTGLITKDDELEGLCWEIREAISKLKFNTEDENSAAFADRELALKDFQLGSPIAKGCSAVVYAARLDREEATTGRDEEGVRAVVKETGGKVEEIGLELRDSISSFPLAIKMMFNYDIQSSAMAILRGMYRETVPARLYYNSVGISGWEVDLHNRRPALPPHPNIVAMYSVFTDYVPILPGALGLYPAALPSRLNPDGAGRNMSLFLLMKRYDCSLQEYVSGETPSVRTAVLLLAQLLEGITHINMHGIAHRDLKSDNILLDKRNGEAAPVLVITDFGCCLADKSVGLHLPFNSMEIDKGGNTALMAPEVIGRKPGTFSVINYTKSDLWAAGSIAYEIFGLANPFYGAVEGRLKSTTYKEEDLPPLPAEVPTVIRRLVQNLLSRNPKKRLPAEIAANVCQLYLWAPSNWLKTEVFQLPTNSEILQWLLCLTTKILCGEASQKQRLFPEHLLIASFLARARLREIRHALQWIHA